MGPVGAAVAMALHLAFGRAAYGLAVGLGATAVRLFGIRLPTPGSIGLAALLGTVFTGVLFHLGWGGPEMDAVRLPGGLVGEVAGEVLRGLFSTAGATLLSAVAVVVTLLVTTRVSIVWLAAAAGRALVRGGVLLGRGMTSIARAVVLVLGSVAGAWRRSRQLLDARKAAEPPPVLVRAKDPISLDDVVPEPAACEPDLDPPPEHEGGAEPGTEVATAPPELTVRTSKKPRKRERIPHPEQVPVPEGGYELPPLSLLDKPPDGSREIDVEAIKKTARRLTEALAHFEVRGDVVEAQPGPVVTMYEFTPAPGTRISRVEPLAGDLAMNLEVESVRIVAPIRGKNRIGFEIPNRGREMVFLRELLADERFRSRRTGVLPLALGKDITGNAVFADLARMPHLLVAGATGTGKSVGLNSMLSSLLYRFTPAELRLLMIDPKVVELAVFDGIPHLLLPVQKDMRRAALALRWAVDEMERRFQLFADFGTRDVFSYNRTVSAIAKGEKSPPPAWQKSMVGASDADDGEEAETGEASSLPQHLPMIVVVVDEFADLMMVAAKDVEGAIQRLAQKARAAGIHLLLATQRPSVNVITGVIKANFSCRIAFRVASKTDSKVIFESAGAETLLGQGDMLFLGPGASGVERVHGAFVSEEEVKRLTDFLRNQGAPVYDEGILRAHDDEEGAVPEDDSDSDEFYDQALRLVSETRKASVSYIQRRLRIGYNRAARLVERMEREGVVGPAQGSGREREVLIQGV